MKFIVLWTLCGNSRVNSLAFKNREDVRTFCNQLSQREDIAYYASHRIGEKLGSFQRHGETVI